MAKWEIPVEWVMRATAVVEAPTLELAIDAAEQLEGFPDNGEYEDDSYRVTSWLSQDDIRDDYNDGQQDEPEELFFKFKKGDRVLFDGELHTIRGLFYRDETPEYAIRPVNAGTPTCWMPIRENELRNPNSGNSAGIQELFD